MSAKVNPIPDGFTAITPYLIVHDGAAALAFYEKAFAATATHVLRAPDGSIRHASLGIGGAMLMLGQHDRLPPNVEGMLPRLSIYLYVEDADATYQRAVECGGTPVYPVSLKPYGNREGGVLDPFGVTWWVATQVEIVDGEELGRRMG